jgi:arylsulfatase A-like enzyme
MIPAEQPTRFPLNWAREEDIAVQKLAETNRCYANSSVICSMLCRFFRLPQAVWARLLVLFVALTGIKLALVAGLGKRLVDAHWRLTPHEPVWGDYVLFGFFVLVGFLSLLRLQRQCALAGIRAIRGANAIVLCLGLLLIFFSFHAQNNNYLYPILSGILNWNSLIPYLSLDLFFQPPFLGGWLFVYTISYYLLARTGRERWVLHLTAIFGTVYAFMALRELAESRTELLVASGLGVSTLLLGRHQDGKVPMRWLLAPLLWCVFFATELLWFAIREIGLPFTYFWLFAYGSVLLFAGATLIAYRRGFGAGWSHVLLFYFSAFLMLSNRNYPAAANFNNVVCLGLELPHYLVGECVVVGILALVAGIYKMVLPRARFWWLDLVSLVLIAMAFVDLRLTQIMGSRLGWDVLALGGNAKMMWRMSKPYLPGAVCAVVLLAAVYAVVLRVVQSRFSRRSAPVVSDERKTVETVEFSSSGGTSQKRGVNKTGFWYAASAFSFLALIGLETANPDKAEGQAGLRLVETSSLWKRATTRTMKPGEFIRTAKSLGLGEFNTSMVAPVTSRADLNVVLVFLESTYNKHLSLFSGSEETQPLLSRYRDRMELYPNFFSSFASSIHARFATFTSLYPVKDYNAFTLERVPVKSIFEVLHENGYACSMFYSSFLDYTGFRSFLQGRGFDAVYDAESMPGERTTEPVAWGLREEETLGAIQRQIKAYGSNHQRFFLTYVPAAPHYPYERVPDRFHKYKPGEMGDYSPLYYNELLYIDWVLASIVEELESSGLLDKTVVIITNDHGEMLGDHGGPIGHGFILSPELANTPLIIMDPRKHGYRINETIGSQIDLLPTMLDLLGIPIPSEELYEGCSLTRAAERKASLIYLNSMQEFGVIAGNRLMFGDREKDKGALTRAFTIGNSGCKTVFNEDGANLNRDFSIQRFDEFQANLLRNYSLYQDAVRGSSALALKQ